MTRRIVAALACAVLLVHVLAPAASAGINVNRNGDENPVQEVAKSTLYGALTGLVVGGALALASDSNDNDAQLVRSGIVAGTFLGLGLGLWWVTKRPQPSSALEWKDGTLRASLPEPAIGRNGRPRVTLARMVF